MKIAVIVASPRRESGLTYHIAKQLCDAAQGRGAETEILFLIDNPPDFCRHCCNTCFDTRRCRIDANGNMLNDAVNRADGLVLAFPVYIWLHNSLLGAFLEKYRRAENAAKQRNGRPAVAIAAAGNSGIRGTTLFFTGRCFAYL